jgi:Nucleotidyltransferase domain
LLTGSAAEGTSDYYSDLDVVVYYDGHLPNDAQLASARQLVNASDFRARAPRSDDAYVEEYAVRGVACEILHTTVAAWELQMAAVLQDVSKLNSGPSGRLSSRGPAA